MTATTNAVPNPGSQEAINRGCTCPVIDNHHGEGVPMGGGSGVSFWMNAGCPVHAPGPANVPQSKEPRRCVCRYG